MNTATAIIRMCEAVWAACPWAAPADFQKQSTPGNPIDELFKHFTEKP